MKQYNVAIVGTGSIVATHVDAFRAIPGFNVEGIFGRDRERTRKVASDIGVRAFEEYEEILSDPDIHVVDIATSSSLHAHYGLKAAQHCKNLIIEKPIDTSPEKAAELISLCERNNCLLEVIHQHRHDESIIMVKEMIEKGALGKIEYGKFSCRPKRDLEYYRADRDKCRGVLKNNAIHFIDLMIYLMGREPLSHKGMIRRTRDELEVEDYAHVLLEFEGNDLFEIDIITNLQKSLPTILEIHGEKGAIFFLGRKIKYLSLDPPASLASSDFKLYMFDKFKIPLKFNDGTHEDVFRNYLDALNGEKQVLVDGMSALASLKIVDDIYNNS